MTNKHGGGGAGEVVESYILIHKQREMGVQEGGEEKREERETGIGIDF